MKNVKTKKTLITLIRLLFLALFVVLIANGQMVLWLALFGVSLVAEIVFGRFYCGYMCPMNTVMIPTDWLSRKLKIKTDKAPEWLKSGRFAWAVLGVSMASMLVFKRLMGINLSILPILLGLSVLVTLRYHPSFFHNLLCPFGAVQKIFAKKPVFSQRVDQDKCIGCKLCEKVCPSTAITVTATDRKAHVRDNICHQCTNCQQVCPKFAISYAKM